MVVVVVKGKERSGVNGGTRKAGMKAGLSARKQESERGGSGGGGKGRFNGSVSVR